MSSKSNISVGIDEKVSFIQALLLGLQHVLAMDVYVVPFIIAGILKFSQADTSTLIQSTFLAAGIATIIQTHFFMKLPVAQGPSFIPIGAIVGIYFTSSSNGWETFLGASLIGAILVIILGKSGLFEKFINNFVPPIIGGIIILIVGLSLMPVAINSNIIGASENLNLNIILALISGASLILFALLGIHLKIGSKIIRSIAIILALIMGCIVANINGVMDFRALNDAPLISGVALPFKDFNFKFEISSIITMLIIYLVLLAETTGTWFAISNVVDKEITKENLNNGVIGEGLGCLSASLLGSTPVTGYSTNAGIISITGIASKKVFVFAGFWFIVLAFSSKLATLISIIPTAVIGGVFLVVCGIIAVSGLKIIAKNVIGEKEMYLIAIAMIVTLTISLLPSEYVQSLPKYLQYVLGSSVASASIIVIILNKVIPDSN